MQLDLEQLRTLRAVVERGTLDGAAKALHVTPSAVSQRLKALETTAGRVLLVRSKPARADAGGRGRAAARAAGRAARRRHERGAGAGRGAAAARGRRQRRFAGDVVPAGDRAAGRRGGDRAAPRGRGQHRAAAARGHGGRGDHLRRRAGVGLHGHRARGDALPADGLEAVRAPLAAGRPDRGGARRRADDGLRPRRRAPVGLPARALAGRRPAGDDGAVVGGLRAGDRARDGLGDGARPPARDRARAGRARARRARSTSPFTCSAGGSTRRRWTAWRRRSSTARRERLIR